MVYSLGEAMNWFLENSIGSVICVKDGVQIECKTYAEASLFYQNK